VRRLALTLRTRLALGTSAVVAVLVLAFAIAILIAATAHVMVENGNQARSVASEVSLEALYIPSDAAPQRLLNHYRMSLDPQVWLLRGGNVVAHSPNAPLSPPDRGKVGPITSLEVWRATRAASDGLTVIVDVPMSQDFDLLRELLFVLVLGAIATAVAGALVSRWAVHRVLDPVDQMSAAAAATADRGTPFVPPPLSGEPDEFTRLADVLTRLVAHLEERNARQRRFLAEAAHELRTPLAVMSGNLDLLSGWGGEDPDVRSESLDVMQRTVKRMRRLVDDLLVLERAPVATVNAGPVDLLALAGELADDVRALAPALTVTVAPSAAILARADGDAVRRVAWALLENAMAYTPDGGQVRLVVGGDRQSAWLAVEDTGPGIPVGERERVFDRFYRGSTASAQRPGVGGGMGMGLAIARALAAAQGGTLELGEAPGGGTRAEIRLRRAPADASPPGSLAAGAP